MKSKSKPNTIDDLLANMPKFKEIEKFESKYRFANISGVIERALCLHELTEDPHSNLFALAVPSLKRRPCSAPFNERAIPFRRRFSKIIQSHEDLDTKRDGRTRKEERGFIKKKNGKRKIENKNCYVDYKRVGSFLKETTDQLKSFLKVECGLSEAIDKRWANILTQLLNWRIRLDLHGIACPHDKILSTKTVRTKLDKIF